MMKRTISVMVGKGSVSHNSRQFHATNTDPERSEYNVCYDNDPIRDVYHELFDDALKRYNDKQKRSDRVIDNYYEKIKHGNQEKPFYEIILQIGDHINMNAKSEDGKLAATVLDNYMKTFKERNPNLRVFSAHLHMDEATPHLHIDFVPFVTGSKRGLETRVSLKQALATQGFKGGTRQETEWNQWVLSEKEQLANIMREHGIEWEHKATHEKHLSVLDYEKKMRAGEVAELEEEISFKSDMLIEMKNDLVDTKNILKGAKADKNKALLEVKKAETELSKVTPKLAGAWKIAENYRKDPEKELPKADLLESAKSYRENKMKPLYMNMIELIHALHSDRNEAVEKYSRFQNRLNHAESRLKTAEDTINRLRRENNEMFNTTIDFRIIQNALGKENVESIIQREKAAQQAIKQKTRHRDIFVR